MDGELLVYGLLPLAVALGLAAWSVYSFVRRRSVIQGLCATVIVPPALFAAWMLLAMALGAWPTFLPHIIIALLLPVLIAQLVLARHW